MASNTIKQLQWRYATKSFDPSKKLSEEKIDLLKESFNLTATSYGLQPLKMVVISNDATKKELVSMTMDQKQVVEASHVLVLCIESTITKEFIVNYFDRVEQIRNTPRSILHPFESFLVASFSEKSRNSIKTWMEKQAYLAMGNLLTVCALEGIDACPIEGFEPKKYDEFLDLGSKGIQSVLVLAVGYRAEDDFFSELKKVRRGTQEVIIDME